MNIESDSKVSFHKEDNVTILTNWTIDEAIHHFPYLLINFYKSDEDASQTFHGIYTTNVSIKLNEQIPHVPTAMIDINYYPDLEIKYNLTSFPTLTFFTYRNIKSLKYITNPRLIIAWVNKDLTFATTSLGTIREVKELINETELVSIVYFGSNKTEMIEFETVAFRDHKRFYGKCSNKLAYQYYNVTPGSIVLFKPYDERMMIYNDTFSNPNIAKFINHNSNEYIVFQCNVKAYHKLVNELYPTVFYFRNGDYVTIDDVLLTSSSRKYKGLVQFVVCDNKSKDEKMLMTEFNITRGDLPILIIADYRKGKKLYKMQTITSGMINEFISEWYLGKMMTYEKSQPIDYSRATPVSIIGSKTYYEDVIMSDLDVFIMFYGANCTYCDYVYPKLTELAIKLKHNNKLVIASFNLSENDFDVFDFHQLPTIILFPAQNKFNFVIFKGMHYIKEYESFLKKHVTYNITLEDSK